jgi:hypothetical protein
MMAEKHSQLCVNLSGGASHCLFPVTLPLTLTGNLNMEGLSLNKGKPSYRTPLTQPRKWNIPNNQSHYQNEAHRKWKGKHDRDGIHEAGLTNRFEPADTPDPITQSLYHCLMWHS